MKWVCAIMLMLPLVVLFSCTTAAPAHPSDNSSAPSSDIPPSARVPRFTVDELLQKINSHADILIVDSRIDVEKLFADGHIPGAIPVPLSAITGGEWLPPSDQNQEIIFYCT